MQAISINSQNKFKMVNVNGTVKFKDSNRSS